MNSFVIVPLQYGGRSLSASFDAHPSTSFSFEDDAPVLQDDHDVVPDEAARWANLDKKTILEFRDDKGIVNEFALMHHLRRSFPLHYIVFKQTASHIPHEGNNEQLFSRSGYLSDDNGRMNPAHLAVWTSIGEYTPEYTIKFK